MNQRGFATLEVILMVMVIGILASIAVPRFTSATTAANTARIQADLSSIDTAISIYYMEQGKYPTELSQLDDYLRGASDLKSPSGSAYIDGKETSITATAYGIDGERAYYKEKNNTAEKFYLPDKPISERHTS